MRMCGEALRCVESSGLPDSASFEQLQKVLQKRFGTNILVRDASAKLNGIAQKRDESVASYVSRFNEVRRELRYAVMNNVEIGLTDENRAATLKVYEANVVHTFVSGLVEDLQCAVTLARPANLDEAIDRAEEIAAIKRRKVTDLNGDEGAEEGLTPYLLAALKSKGWRPPVSQNAAGGPMRQPWQGPPPQQQQRTATPAWNPAEPAGPYSNLRCYQCSLPGHRARECQTMCYQCRQIGHIGRNCPQRVAYPAPPSGPRFTQPPPN